MQENLYQKRKMPAENLLAFDSHLAQLVSLLRKFNHLTISQRDPAIHLPRKLHIMGRK